MGLYNKPALDLLGALINRDNPEIPTKLSSANIIVLGGPYTTSLGNTGRNTRVQVNGIAGSGVSGKMEFFYDRLNLSDLFKNITVVFAGDGSSTKVKDLLPALNEQYGLNLTAADISNGDTALDYAYTATPVSFTIASGSLNYRGTLTATWSRKPVGIFPESGPGPKTMLIGSLTEGYFGKVTNAEMMSQGEFYLNYFADKDTGVAIPNNDSAMHWFKFALDGKFVFVPSHNLVTNVTWDQLSALGAAEGDAAHPFLLEKGEETYFFQLRLPKLSATFGIAPGRDDPTGDNNRLFNKVHRYSYGTGEWGAIATMDLGAAFLWWNKRSDVTTSEQRYATQFNTVSVNSVLAAALIGWRPMFTLVDGKLVRYPVYNITGVPTGRIKAPVLTIDRNPDPLLPKRVTNVQGSLLRSFSKPRLWPLEAAYVTAVKNIVARRAVKPFSMRFTIVVDTRIKLDTAIGELDGFR